MTKEMVRKFRCSRVSCSNVEEVVSKGVLGLHTKGKLPKGWSSPLGDDLCPSCSADFKKLYASFIKGGK